MHRKIVFRGSFLTRDLTEADRTAVAEALAALHRLADKGAIEFQRNAGKTVTPPRRPDNVLTPQALTILQHAAAATEDFLVSHVTATTGMNRNSATAHLSRLSGAGYLARRGIACTTYRGTPGSRTNWAYGITDLGRDVVASLAPDPDEPAVPGP